MPAIVSNPSILAKSRSVRSDRSPYFGTGVYPKAKINFAGIYANFVERLSSETGAATTFLGVARNESADGNKKVRALVMESYEKHANKALKKICHEIKVEFGLTHIVIVHALGRFNPGEPVVLVALSSSRREASFKALREAVERYKKEPAIFKQEIYNDGSSSWIK